MTHRARYGLFFLIPVIIVLDQWSKWLILNEPVFNAIGCVDRTQRCGRIEVLPFFDLTMVWNRGISFGIGQSEGIMRWVLVLLTTAIAIGFTVWLVNATRRFTGLALALVIGGAFGNVIDRVRFGAVVDSSILAVFCGHTSLIMCLMLPMRRFLLERSCSLSTSS